MNRRSFFATGAAAIAMVGAGAFRSSGASAKDKGPFPFTLTEAEWRERLTPMQFDVLRKEATERPFSSPLDKESREGIFACAGCEQPLYPSDTKFDSRTGWPSFWAPISEDAIGKSTDYYLIYPRTEVHCSNCGGHQGHIFNDGPKPTGKRHCINGVALMFIPAEGAA